jgi:hypothetical protein
MIRDRRWFWLLVALPPLLYLPLHAQDGAQVPPQSPPRETPPAADAPSDSAPAAEPSSSDAPDPSEERVSADNNLSFPVDI